MFCNCLPLYFQSLKISLTQLEAIIAAVNLKCACLYNDGIALATHEHITDDPDDYIDFSSLNCWSGTEC